MAKRYSVEEFAKLHDKPKLSEQVATSTAFGVRNPSVGGQTTSAMVSNEDGFFEGAAKGIVRPFARVATNLKKMGDVNDPNYDPNAPVNFPWLGEVKPIGQSGDFVRDVKDAAGVGAEVASILIGGGGTKEVVKQGVKWLVKQGVKIGAKEGAVAGAAQMGGQALGEDKSMGEVLGDTVLGAAGGSAGGALGGGVFAGAGSVIRKAFGRVHPEKLAILEKEALDEALELTRPVLNKKGSISAFEQAGMPGGVTKEGKLSEYKVKPTERDIEVAKSVQGVVTKSKGPVDNIVAINERIADIAENEVSQFLKNNPVPFNFEDLRAYMTNAQPSFNFKTDKDAFVTYRQVRERILSKIYSSLKGKSAKSGDFGSTTDFNDVWDARKEIDRAIADELGAVTFDTPQYSGVRAAARDVREAFSGFISDSLATPGQMEKVNRMQEFLQEARKRGMDIDTEGDALKVLEQEFGISRSTADEARVAFFKDRMNQLNLMYEARGNLAEQNYKLLDKNAVQRWMKQNPTKANLLKYGIGVGSGGAILGGLIGD
jgi:hypothetical protein